MQPESETMAGDATQVMNKMTVKEHIEMYWKFFFEKGEKIPTERLPQKRLEYTQLFGEKKNGLKTAWLGHSSLLINIDGYSILTDPVFEAKVSPVGPTRFNKELPITAQDVSAVDVVIISHDHYDHLNKYSVLQLVDKTGLFIVPLGVGKRLEKWGVPVTKIVELNWWDDIQPLAGLTITATPSQHFSGRGLFDRNSTLWASWVIKTDNHSLFFSGDSGYFDGFKKIGEQYGPFDVTFLECGAYNEGWSNVHMFPEETVQAFFDLGGKVLQPIHWATFNLALHSWYEPAERLVDEALEKGATISTPLIGQVVDYNETVTADLWWREVLDNQDSRSSEQQVVSSYQ